MFSDCAVVFCLIFTISLSLAFCLCGDDNKILWPIKLCFVSFVMMIVCAIIAEIKGEHDDNRYDCLCHLCNKLYQVKQLDKAHVVKISPCRSVYVCDKCFYSLNKIKEEK